MKRSNHIQTLLSIATAVSLSLIATSSHANNLLGIDVSSAQGSINWTSVKSDGVQFAFAKATEGTSVTDSDFSGNMKRGKSAGVQMGAYHFAYPDINCPSAEVNHFWNVAGPYILADGKSISPAIDLEIFQGLSCGFSTYTAWANKFNSLVKAKTSSSLNCVAIVSCCDACYFNSNITLGSWILNYNGQNLYTSGPWTACCTCNVWDPNPVCNSKIWDYWGVTSTGAISGIPGNVDLDAYNGTLTQLVSQQGVGGI